MSHGDARGEFPVAVRGVSLHGSKHDLTISAMVRREGNTVTIHCTFAVPFVQWGLEDPSILMFKVAKQVMMNVTADARLTWTLPTSVSDRINAANRP
jgi:hypothetical protein